MRHRLNIASAVIATDAAGNASEAQSVTLDINDIDDVAPAFLSGSNATIIENSGSGQVVYTATADDSADISDGVTFSLLSGTNLDPALTIDATTGEVTLNEQPDFEAKPEYFFTVLAEDGSGQGVVKHVTLSVINVDDTAPTILSSDSLAVNENIGAGQLIYTATADDSLDISAGVTFSLAEGSDAALAIDSVSGAVTLATDPDHEIQVQYSFAVIATDAAGNASEAHSVTLDINDLDDAAPTVTSGDTAVAIDENSGAGQVVYMATADDTADDVADTPMAFSLTEGSDAGLTIDSTTGAVTLAADPDHETQSQYSFAVIATDAAGNVSEAQSVTLDINDLDDAAPTVTSGATAVAIDENSGAGQVIYTATSTDVVDDVLIPQLPIAWQRAVMLRFQLMSTGAVTLSTDPDHETQAQYSFAVIATDAAGNASDCTAQ